MEKKASRIKAILESTPLFLILVPAYVLIHLEKIFHHLVNYKFAAGQIIIMIIAAIILALTGRLITRNKKKGWIISFVLMLSWFYLGIVKNYLQEHFPDIFLSSYSFILPLCAVLISVICYRTIRSNSSYNRLFLFINSLWIIFISMDGISILVQDFSKSVIRDKYAVNYTAESSADSLRPDIYYVIFDSYSGSSVLKKIGFDNSMIENDLRKKGFMIIGRSTSNYNLTSFSMGSTLSMKYIKNADTSKKYYLDDYLPAANIVKFNGLVPWLEKLQYSIHNFSFFDIEHHPALIPSGAFWDIDVIYLQQNAGLKIYKDLSWNFKLPSLKNAGRIQADVDKRDAYDDSVYASLLHIAKTSTTSPRFVYAHFFMPHIPNSHDSNGNRIPVNTKLTVPEEMKGYASEIKFVNKRINNITEAILQNPNRPLVIIFQGDHGYRFYDNNRKADEFPNFNAVYFSNKDYNRMPDTLSNVNLFKGVLNTWFNQNIPFDTNRHFFLRYK
jgi:hypothetical protein